MGKFNQSNVGVNKTVNNCGVTAYKMQDKEKLVTMVLTSMFGEEKFYGDNSKELLSTAKNLIQNGQGQFVSNLAVYARKEMHLRSVTHALASILANEVDGKPFIKSTIKGIVERVDDITEILAYYINTYGKPIPNGLKKALATAMLKFNEYQFAKYNGGSKQVKLRDVLRITHPLAKDEAQSALFKAILDDALATPYTWETELSANGNNKETWEKLIESGKVGYMALLRNLNNIVKAQPNNIQKVYDTISNKDNVLKSKQLPFRFLSAYNVLKLNPLCTSKVLDTLELAIRHSVGNMEKLKGKTLIAIDVSGSMQSRISANSEVFCSDIACIMASLANHICEESSVVTFDTNLYQLALSTTNGIISNAKSINVNGGGTDITLPIRYILNNKMNFDRIIMLSDDEINSGWNDGSWHFGNVVPCQSLVNEYRKNINADIWVHAIDLQGYGTQQFNGIKTNIIAGWNEKVLEFIGLAEKGMDNITKTIENYIA